MQATSGVFPRAAARVRLSAIEWVCVALATIVAHAFLLHEWLYPSAWDATSYVNIGREIAERGLWSKFEGSGFRTYGYPLVLSFVLCAPRHGPASRSSSCSSRCSSSRIVAPRCPSAARSRRSA